MQNETAWSQIFSKVELKRLIIMLRNSMRSAIQSDNGDNGAGGAEKRRSSVKMDRKLQELQWVSMDLISAARNGDNDKLKKIFKERKKDCDVLLDMSDKVRLLH